MKRYVLALAPAAALATGAATAANAQDIDVGPGGVHVGPHHYHYDRDRDYRAYDEYRGGCRVVITHGTNRYGEPTTMRRRDDRRAFLGVSAWGVLGLGRISEA